MTLKQWCVQVKGLDTAQLYGLESWLCHSLAAGFGNTQISLVVLIWNVLYVRHSWRTAQ